MFRQAIRSTFLLLCVLLSFEHSAQEQLQKLADKARIFANEQEYDSALVYSAKLERDAFKANSDHYRIKSYIISATAYAYLNNLHEAQDSYYKGLKLCTNDKEIEQRAIIYSGIGSLNFMQGNYAVAKSNYRDEIGLRILQKDTVRLMNNLMNLSAIHRRLKEYDSSQLVLDKVRKIMGSIKNETVTAYFYNSIGTHFQSRYNQNPAAVSDLDSALLYYTLALEKWKEMKNETEALVPLFNVGLLYQQKKQFDKALPNYLEAYRRIISKPGLLNERITLYGSLAELHYDRKEFLKAADQFRRYIEFKDSVGKVSVSNYALKLDKQFQTDKEIADYAIRLDKKFHAQKSKELIQDQQLAIEKQDKKLYFFLVLILIAVMALIIAGIYFFFRKKLDKEIEEAKKKFFSNVVHEIRTPLSMINAPLKTLKKKYTNEEDLYYIDVAERNVGRLNELINQMLDISKIESSKYTLSETYGDLELFFSQLIKSYETSAKEKEIHFFSQFHFGTKVTFFDKDAIEKITANLLGNAIKYSPAHSKVGIDVFTEDNEAGVQLEISIWDTGPGISPQEQEKVFGRFYRSSETATKTKGAGIGLSLVKDLVELHRGDIELKSELGKGSVFTVNITLKNQKDGAITNVAPANTNTSNPIIMLVEDDEEILAFNAKYLEKNNFTVLKAHHGKEAIDLLEKTLPDLIITDLMMPEIDGLSLLKSIRLNKGTDHIPVIILSAKAASDSRIEALKAGALAYLAKPFLPDELLSLVINQLEILTKRKTEFKEKIEQPALKTEEKFVGTEPYTQKLFKLIFEQLDDHELSVEGLADMMATNRSHFQRKIKSLTGFSPSELIKAVRMEKAKELLLAKKGNITEVAYLTGFSSQSYFTRCFTQHFGTSPTQMLHDQK
jgi:signal transduction histidine kinase/CheY-like chemotaxis protein/AraC-like DNA-binding protein